MISVAKTYEERLGRGKPREGILNGLAARYSRDTRTIERWISRGRQLKRSVNAKETVARRFQEHCDELAQVAEGLAFNLKKLIDRPSYLEYVRAMHLSIVDGGWINSRGWLDSYSELPPDREIPAKLEKVDSYVAGLVLEHLNYQHPELAYYKEWQEVTSWPIKKEVMDKLLLLAHSKAFKPCPSCGVCAELGLVSRFHLPTGHLAAQPN